MRSSLIILFSTTIITILAMTTSSKLKLPDYDYSILRGMRKNSMRQRFLEKRLRSHRDKITKLKVPSTNSVYVEGIAHFPVNQNDREARRMEKALRKLLAMKAVTYVYKRDLVWRTWREVKYPKGKRVVSYRCSNVVNSTCNNCRSGGYWSIEENTPPCPFEIYSMITANKVCASNYNQFSDSTKACPSVINRYDISRSCENPTITDYRITKNFNVSERMPEEICGGLNFCRIATFYRFFEDYILFRLTNASNNIVYSKIMKTGQKNYICLSDCGRIDRTIEQVTIKDEPIAFNLLPSHKNKRDSYNDEEKKKKSRRNRQNDFSVEDH